MSKQENMILLENGELATNKENDTDSMLSLEDASDAEHVVQGGFGYLMSSPFQAQDDKDKEKSANTFYTQMSC